jgi:hypothetical protein
VAVIPRLIMVMSLHVDISHTQPAFILLAWGDILFSGLSFTKLKKNGEELFLLVITMC